MNKNKISFRTIPGWVYTLLAFGFLYFSGLHTEAIGQVQRVILATGIMQPDLPTIPERQKTALATNGIPNSAMAEDFLLQDLNGNTVKFSSLKNKVIFLNIWA